MATVQTVSSDLLSTMNGTTTSSSSSSADDVQDRFMTLLIAQMKNQDPLNPMDNAEVTSQMAQLSTVTGIEKLNTTLEGLISDSQSAQTYEAANMIGHYVLTEGNTMTLSDGSAYFGVNLPDGADSGTLTIKDANGNTVREIDFGTQDAGVMPLSWDGYSNDGSTAADGTYTFEVTATVAGTSVTAIALAYDKVLSVSNTTSGIKLNLSTLDAIGIDDVVEVY
jgi:flagellar basal-body rod modification protein FlgD